MFKLVIDANIILSALIRDSITRKILIGSEYIRSYMIIKGQRYMINTPNLIETLLILRKYGL